MPSARVSTATSVKPGFAERPYRVPHVGHVCLAPFPFFLFRLSAVTGSIAPRGTGRDVRRKERDSEQQRAARA